MVQATSSSQITPAWQRLGLYRPCGEVDWKMAAKMFDDWNLVLTGTAAQHFWRLHGVAPHPSQRNVHSLYLCFNCSVAARWGPCEHMYALMLHQNAINESEIPKAKPKGRPRKRPFSPENPNLLLLQPGPAAEPRPSQRPAPARLLFLSPWHRNRDNFERCCDLLAAGSFFLSCNSKGQLWQPSAPSPSLILFPSSLWTLVQRIDSCDSSPRRGGLIG